MKKKLLALILVFAMLLSCALMLTSCPGDGPSDTPGGGDTPDPELNLDEGLNEGTGSSNPSAITDPSNPEASGNEDKYIHDR